MLRWWGPSEVLAPDEVMVGVALVYAKVGAGSVDDDEDEAGKDDSKEAQEKILASCVPTCDHQG